ncbi:hypothetical protein XELAEV_18035603mg [Xenopus laevis]|uniref:Protein RER1 n=2 Tax=Xenopus laevis TaxID=8355 RepID=A0A974CG29_XENLA|nr:hypothetical protein XELAEV_18035603mg [Xenopus laevis]
MAAVNSAGQNLHQGCRESTNEGLRVELSKEGLSLRKRDSWEETHASGSEVTGQVKAHQSDARSPRIRFTLLPSNAVTCTHRELSVPTRARPRRNRMSEGDSIGDSVHGKPSVVFRFFSRLGQIYQSFLDKSTPYTAVRWVMTLGLSAIYMIRVYILQGWYIVTYAMGIYHLNLFIAFLSPKVDPSLMEDSDEGPSLPTKQNEEFRPFIRRLPEFKFWHSATKGVVVAMGCTFFDAFNVPVFWPILVMYFIMLFCITMKRQIKHMIKYRYIPFTHGKRKYKGKEEPTSGKPFSS